MPKKPKFRQRKPDPLMERYSGGPNTGNYENPRLRNSYRTGSLGRGFLLVVTLLAVLYIVFHKRPHRPTSRSRLPSEHEPNYLDNEYDVPKGGSHAKKGTHESDRGGGGNGDDDNTDDAESGDVISDASLAVATSTIQAGHVTVILAVRTAQVPTENVQAIVTEAAHRSAKTELVVVFDPNFFQSSDFPKALSEELSKLNKTGMIQLHQVSLPPSPKGKKPSLASLATLYEAGAKIVSPNTSHLLFLSESRVIHSPHFIEEMLQPLVLRPDVAVVQATVLIPSNTTEKYVPGEVEDDKLEVLDRGFNAALSVEHDKFAVRIHRRLGGFSALDHRTSKVDTIDMASPYCMMVDRQEFLKHHKFSTTTNDILIDKIVQGKLDPLELVRSLEVLKYRINLVEKTMEAITIAEVHRAGSSLRQQVRISYSEVVEGSTLYEDVSKRNIDAQGSSIYRNLEKDEKKLTADVDNSDIERRLRRYSKLLVEVVKKVRNLGRLSDTSNSEESLGWELSLRLMHSGKKAVVSPARVVMDPHRLPPKVTEYMKGNHANLHYGSYSLSGQWEERWGKQLKRRHPAYTTPGDEARLHIVWDAYCCGCCGFSTEIEHFIIPLERLIPIHTFMAPSCFCKGSPSSVEDALARVHVEQNRFSHLRWQPNEHIVWIAHTDPFGWRNPVWDKRKPDYLIGRSMYEFSKVGKNWVDATGIADEIWVPAPFVFKMFHDSGIPEDKLVLIPEPLDTNFYDPAIAGKMDLPLAGTHKKWIHWCNHDEGSPEAYKFFSNFKWEPRKGWEILLEAYFHGFENKPKSSVSLYILSYIFLPTGEGDMHNVTLIKQNVEELRERLNLPPVETWPHFCVITEMITDTELLNFYNSVDAFVLPTRGEGWGLPTIQAMSMGLPTLSTGWGGNLGFMHVNNSFLIDLDGVEEVPVASIYGWEPGKKWATPSMHHTSELMQLVVSNPAYGRKVGAIARADISRRFSEEAVAKIVMDRLEVVKRRIVEKKRAAS